MPQFYLTGGWSYAGYKKAVTNVRFPRILREAETPDSPGPMGYAPPDRGAAGSLCIGRV
jgi:hypothetical protein